MFRFKTMVVCFDALMRTNFTLILTQSSLTVVDTKEKNKGLIMEGDNKKLYILNKYGIKTNPSLYCYVNNLLRLCSDVLMYFGVHAAIH